MIPHAKIRDCIGKKLVKVVWHNLHVYLVFEDVYAGLGYHTDADGETNLTDHALWSGDFYTAYAVGVITKEEYDNKVAERKAREDAWKLKSDREHYERLKKQFETPTEEVYRG